MRINKKGDKMVKIKESELKRQVEDTYYQNPKLKVPWSEFKNYPKLEEYIELDYYRWYAFLRSYDIKVG